MPMVYDASTGKTTYIEYAPIESIELTPEQLEQRYKDRVDELIREQYSQSDVESIFRKKLAGDDNGEFDTFNSFAEQCKIQAASELNYN